MSASLLQKSKALTKRIQRRNEKLRKVEKFHWHEALHVSSIIAEIFDRYIADHAAIQSYKFLVEKVDIITDELWELYNQISKRRKM